MSQNKGVNREGISGAFFDNIFNWSKYRTIKIFNQVKNKVIKEGTRLTAAAVTLL